MIEGNIHREEDSDSLIQIFETVSDLSQNGSTEKNIPTEAKQAGLIGAIIIGSCTTQQSQPKDIDVIFVIDKDSNPRAEYYSELISSQFDEVYILQNGRFALNKMDQQILSLTNSSDILQQAIRKAIQNTQDPIIYSYNKDGYEKIYREIERIKNQQPG